MSKFSNNIFLDFLKKGGCLHVQQAQTTGIRIAMPHVGSAEAEDISD